VGRLNTARACVFLPLYYRPQGKRVPARHRIADNGHDEDLSL
jgi:hypothetical protein